MPKKILTLAVLVIISLFIFTDKTYAQVEDDGIELVGVEINGQSDPQPATITPVKPSSTRPSLPRGGIKQRINDARQNQMKIRENIKNRASKSATKRIEKLSEARKKVCETRKSNIAKRLNSSQSTASKIHTGHFKIFQRVDNFYKNKLVPNGYTLENYDDLVLEVNTNKETVEALHTSMKENGANFDCDSDDPKGQVGAFREDLQNLVEANKNYKESIKAYVQAVLDLARKAKLDKESVSPTETEEEVVE